MHCTRCDTTWIAGTHSGTLFMKGGGNSPYLTGHRAGRRRFERIIEHHGSDKPVREQGGRQSLAARLAIGRRLFGTWFGAIAVVIICASIAILVLHSPLMGIAPAI